ncbi:hypothetical protein [Hyphomicrobium sp. ghe19]|uniref:hypothetical protein n=1 Tax=Hyphomicrobium sp. ghe19 TaxID=2682968 RepID=UPI0030CACC90
MRKTPLGTKTIFAGDTSERSRAGCALWTGQQLHILPPYEFRNVALTFTTFLPQKTW